MKRRGIVLAFLMRLQADLQPSLAMARRRRLGRGGQRQVRAPARHRRGGRRPAGEGARLHPVQGDDGAAGGVPRRRCSAGRASSCMARRRSKKRKDLVRRFQEDDDVPFFVLSLKAGGAGLNLTAASHVIHFDRWWNPAVENQATDRAFRIGQTKNVLVHKFVCRGTVEEKIDQLIESKKQLAGDFLGGGAEMPSDRDEGRGAAEARRARSGGGDEGGAERMSWYEWRALCAGGREAAAGRAEAGRAQEEGHRRSRP